MSTPESTPGSDVQTVAIVGGHGKIARLALPLLLEHGHTVVPLVRKPEQIAALTDQGAQPRPLDIENQSEVDFARAFEGVDAVIFAAGGGPDGNALRKRTVDLEGSLKTIEGARLAGVSRVLQISAIGVDGPIDDDMGAVWASYVVAKRDADEALRESGLDWTIVRPGGLTDDEPTGTVTVGTDVGSGEIPRADVAAVLVHALHTPGSVNQQVELISGSTPIASLFV